MPETGAAVAAWYEAASATEVVATAASAANAASAVKGLTAKTPELQTPDKAPEIDSETVLNVRRRQAAMLQQQSGRASTILTGGSDKLGG